MLYDKIHRVLKTVFPLMFISVNQGKTAVGQLESQLGWHCQQFLTRRCDNVSFKFGIIRGQYNDA